MSNKENSTVAFKKANHKGHAETILRYADHCGSKGFSDNQAINDKIVGQSSYNSIRKARGTLYDNGELLHMGNRINNIGRKESVYVLAKYASPNAKLSPKYWTSKAGEEKLTVHIESDNWAKRRKSYYDKYPKACYITGANSVEKTIDLHHLNYDNLYNEKDNELVPLSREMHIEVETLIKNGVSRSEAHIIYKEIFEKGFERGKVNLKIDLIKQGIDEKYFKTDIQDVFKWE